LHCPRHSKPFQKFTILFLPAHRFSRPIGALFLARDELPIISSEYVECQSAPRRTRGRSWVEEPSLWAEDQQAPMWIWPSNVAGSGVELCATIAMSRREAGSRWVRKRWSGQGSSETRHISRRSGELVSISHDEHLLGGLIPSERELARAAQLWNVTLGTDS
jgi:hypothetical protein